MKKFFAMLIAAVVVFSMAGCVATKILHCDGCNTEVRVKESSNMTEDWIVYCGPCNEKIFGDDPLLGNK